MTFGEEKKDWKRQEQKKQKKERYKSNENLTRKSKVSCIAVVPFLPLSSYSYAKELSIPCRLYDISINLLVVCRESVNLIGYITHRLSADSLWQDSCSRDCIREPLSSLNQYTWHEWHATFELGETQ